MDFLILVAMVMNLLHPASICEYIRIFTGSAIPIKNPVIKQFKNMLMFRILFVCQMLSRYGDEYGSRLILRIQDNGLALDPTDPDPDPDPDPNPDPIRAIRADTVPILTKLSGHNIL